MSERLSLNNSWHARDRMVELVESGRPFSNHSGSFRGEPVTGRYVSTGEMPTNHAEFMRTFAGEIDYVIFSYATPVAWHANGEWYIPDVKYSRTTTRHQSYLHRLGRKADCPV